MSKEKYETTDEQVKVYTQDKPKKRSLFSDPAVHVDEGFRVV